MLNFRLITLSVFFFALAISESQAQDSYDQMKMQYDSLLAAGNKSEALPITKAMNQWALENESDSSLRYAVSFRYIGNCFEENDSSLKYYEFSKRNLEKQKRTIHPDYSKCLNNLGLLYEQMGDYKTAELFYKQALEILKKALSDNHPDCAKSLNNLGLLYYQMGDYKSAEIYYKQALQITENSIGKNHPSYAQILTGLGDAYYELGDYVSAEQYYKLALEITENTLGKDHHYYAISLNSLGLLYEQIGDYKSAEAILLQTRDILRKVLGEDHPDYAKTLNNLGLLYEQIGDFKSAEPYYMQALEILSRATEEDNPESAACLNSLGNLYGKSGNYKSAEQYYKQALEIRRKVLGEDHPDYAKSLHNLGLLYSKLGDYKSAELYYRQAIEIIRRALGEDHPESATCLNNLGDFYGELGDYKSAGLYYKQALQIRRKVFGDSHPDYAISLNSLGLWYYQMGDYKGAEPILRQALEIKKNALGEDHPDYANSVYNLGLLYLKMGDYKTAEPILKKALEIIKKALGMEHPDYAKNLEGLGYFYFDLGNYKSAENYYNQVFELKTHKLKSDFSWLSSNQKLLNWQLNKNFCYFLPSFAIAYASSAPSSTNLSYNSCLTAKSLILDDLRGLTSVIQSSNDTLVQNNFQSLGELRRTLLKLEAKDDTDKRVMDSLRSKADSLDKILVNQVGDYAAHQRRFDIRWTNVQTSLKTEEAAIEFARYYDYEDTIYKYMAQVVRPGYEYPRIVKLCREQDLAAFSGGHGLAELYKLVWQPLDSLLQGVKTVYYSPDGQLHSLPFHALCVNDSGGCTYLMDQYSLHQLSTTRYLADSSLINTKPLNQSIALYGGIRYDVTPDTLPQPHEESNEDFLLANTLKRETTRGAAAYLPGSKAEVEAIAPILNSLQWTTNITTGKEASENRFKALSDTASPSIIHIATHGFAFPDKEEKKKSRFEMVGLSNEQNRYSAADDPMLRCGLMFAGANRSWTGQQQEMISLTGEDGILTAAEVANMDLSNTKLVVLSACETGLGKIEGSEGVFGLQRGFKLAGVEQLIVSLWQVPDKETNTLMTRFYADLASTKDPVKSFAIAQREMRERYPDNPELWAGFVLVR